MIHTGLGPVRDSHRPGLSQYRGPVSGLCLCGTTTYPGGGVHGTCGHNAFVTIASDLGFTSVR